MRAISAEAGSLDGMRSRILRGLAWKAGSQLILQCTRIIVALILARLLTPRDYGLVGMVLVFSSIALVFQDLALGAGLVQRQEISEKDRSTVFWTSAAVGVVLSAVGFVISAPLAALYREPAVQPLFAVLSVSFLIGALGTTQAALLRREMNFRGLELRVIAGTLASAAVGITAAVRGFGPWAIIGQQLTYAAVSTALLWVFSPWRPKLVYSLASLRDLGGFGINLLGTRLLFALRRNSDNLLVGRFLGSAALGAYTVAFNIMLIPLSRLVFPLQEVLYPALSRMQDDPQRVAAVWLRVTRLVAAVSVPALLGMAVVAPDFVPVVLGDRWRAAVPVIQILTWVGILQSLASLNSQILPALDRATTLLKYTIVSFLFSLVGFAVGLHWGIIGVATGYALAATLFIPLYTWVTARAVGTSALAFARSLSGVVQASLVMLVCVWGARLVLIHEHVTPGARLAIVSLLGLAVFLACCRWRAPEVLIEIRSVRRARRRDTALPAGSLSEG